MTELLYYVDSYLQEFDATVRGVEPADGAMRVDLDRTVFYPGGGGQPADSGWLVVGGERFAVTRLAKEGDAIWHWLAAAEGAAVAAASAIVPGAAVRGELDWARRYRLMRTHTAMHILCGVVFRDYGASVTGGNMEPGKGRMDFEFASLSRDLIREIADKCALEVAAAREVQTRTLPRDEAFQIPDLIRTKANLLPPGIAYVRTVEVVGLDLQADGGTHVRNTREVGAMNVVDYKSKGASNKRMYIELP